MSGVLDATDPITSKHQRMYLDRLLREALDAEESAKQEDRGVVNGESPGTLSSSLSAGPPGNRRQLYLPDISDRSEARVPMRTGYVDRLIDDGEDSSDGSSWGFPCPARWFRRSSRQERNSETLLPGVIRADEGSPIVGDSASRISLITRRLGWGLVRFRIHIIVLILVGVALFWCLWRAWSSEAYV